MVQGVIISCIFFGYTMFSRTGLPTRISGTVGTPDKSSISWHKAKQALISTSPLDIAIFVCAFCHFAQLQKISIQNTVNSYFCKCIHIHAVDPDNQCQRMPKVDVMKKNLPSSYSSNNIESFWSHVISKQGFLRKLLSRRTVSENSGWQVQAM